jgi:hypothetical protein
MRIRVFYQIWHKISPSNLEQLFPRAKHRILSHRLLPRRLLSTGRSWNNYQYQLENQHRWNQVGAMPKLARRLSSVLQVIIPFSAHILAADPNERSKRRAT